MNPSAKKSETASGSSKRTVPSPPEFDRLGVMNALRAAAFSEDQATVLVETLGEAHLCLATKDDLDRAFGTLHGDIETSETGIRQDMQRMEAGIRQDMRKMEAGIRQDMRKMEAGIRQDMEKMEAGIRRDMEKMETSIRHDMEKMEASIRHDMVEMKSDLRGEIQVLYAKMEDRFQKVQWFILSSIGGATGILGMMIVFTST